MGQIKNKALSKDGVSEKKYTLKETEINTLMNYRQVAQQDPYPARPVPTVGRRLRSGRPYGHGSSRSVLRSFAGIGAAGGHGPDQTLEGVLPPSRTLHAAHYTTSGNRRAALGDGPKKRQDHRRSAFAGRRRNSCRPNPQPRPSAGRLHYRHDQPRPHCAVCLVRPLDKYKTLIPFYTFSPSPQPSKNRA